MALDVKMRVGERMTPISEEALVVVKIVTMVIIGVVGAYFLFNWYQRLECG
jgi:hypothetical protein